MGSGEPVFDSEGQKEAYYRGEGEPAGYENFKPIGRYVWKEADGSWHAMDNSLGLGINKDAEFAYRHDAMAFARGNHGFETAEFREPMKLEDIESESDLILYAELMQEWTVAYADNGMQARYEKSDVAIVSDGFGLWQIENIVTKETSIELFATPYEALEAIERYRSLDSILNPLDAAWRASQDQQKQQSEAARSQGKEQNVL